METLEVEQQRPEMNMFCPSTTLIEGKRVANSSCQPHHLFILFDRIKIFLFKERYRTAGMLLTNPKHDTKLKSSHTPGYWLAWVETQCAHRVSLHVGHNGDTGGQQGDTGEIWSRWRGQTIYGEARHQQMRNRMAYHGCCKIISICSADCLETIKATIRDHCWYLRATAGVDDLWNILWPISICPHAPAIDCTPFAFSNQI